MISEHNDYLKYVSYEHRKSSSFLKTFFLLKTNLVIGEKSKSTGIFKNLVIKSLLLIFLILISDLDKQWVVEMINLGEW